MPSSSQKTNQSAKLKMSLNTPRCRSTCSAGKKTVVCYFHEMEAKQTNRKPQPGARPKIYSTMPTLLQTTKCEVHQIKSTVSRRKRTAKPRSALSFRSGGGTKYKYVRQEGRHVTKAGAIWTRQLTGEYSHGRLYLTQLPSVFRAHVIIGYERGICVPFALSLESWYSSDKEA